MPQDLDDIARGIIERLTGISQIRDRALGDCRQIVRWSANSVRASHRGDFAERNAGLSHAEGTGIHADENHPPGPEREAAHVLVEPGEEGILVRRLEQGVGAERDRKRSGEAGLARADRALDDDVAAFLDIHGGLSLQPGVAARAGDALSVQFAQPAASGATAGDDHRGRDVQQRPQHERALMHAWMRQGQVLLPRAATAE